MITMRMLTLLSFVGLLLLKDVLSFSRLFATVKSSRPAQFKRSQELSSGIDFLHNRHKVRTSSFQIAASNIDTAVSDDFIISSCRKWYFMNRNTRADVFVSNTKAMPDILADLWKYTLIANNVHDLNKEQLQVINLVAFPNILVKTDADRPTDLDKYQRIAQKVMKNMKSSSPMFSTFNRAYEFLWKPVEGESNRLMLMLALTSTRKRPASADLSDWDVLDLSKTDDTLSNNDIKTFPFPTIFDFISEINRPVDLSSRTQSRFNFRIKDLKYDLKKMSKKKDPQEFVDIINCRLTRLANWRDVLERDRPQLSEFFDPDFDFAEMTKEKYQSLQALVKTNPKKALETQYDKRKTFIDVIDRWSDRLKRHFSYMYKSRGRPPEDFMAPILQSKWRLDIMNITSWFQRVPYLDLRGPDFTPGSPEPLFSDGRTLMWYNDYTAEVAVYEMVTWFHHVNKIITYTHDNNLAELYGPIAQQIYSRGDSTETLLFDTWTGISKWVKKFSATESRGVTIAPVKGSREPMDIQLLQSMMTDNLSLDEEDNHMNDFLGTLRKLNEFARIESNQKGKSVRAMFQKYAKDSVDGVEWWVDLVRNLDMFDELEQIAQERKPSIRWSEIMDDFMEYKIASKSFEDKKIEPTPWFQMQTADPSCDELTVLPKPTKDIKMLATIFDIPDKIYEEVTKAVNVDSHLKSWYQYRNAFVTADYLDSLFPWINKPEPEDLLAGAYSADMLKEIGKHADYDAEVVTIDCLCPAKGQLLITYPRYFRGTGMAGELVSRSINCSTIDLAIAYAVGV
jgi:hypothetical protein